MCSDPRLWGDDVSVFSNPYFADALPSRRQWMTVKDDIADVRLIRRARSCRTTDRSKKPRLKKRIDPRSLRSATAGRTCCVEQNGIHAKQQQRYPGWIRTQRAPKIGREKFSRASPSHDDAAPAHRQRSAQDLIGAPYFWGGRSLYDPGNNKTITTGVDCLWRDQIRVLERRLGQFRATHEISKSRTHRRAVKLKPGDL